MCLFLRLFAGIGIDQEWDNKCYSLCSPHSPLFAVLLPLELAEDFASFRLDSLVGTALEAEEQVLLYLSEWPDPLF